MQTRIVKGGASGSREADGRRGMALMWWIKDGLWVGLVGALSYCLLFNVSVVRGKSMAPGIADGDRILIETWSYAFDQVDRGEVVVLRSPVEPELDYIKRVIGLPGDEVLISDGRVLVNGELLDEPYAIKASSGLYQWTRVSEDHFFVLGDNRPHSSDSREFGLVPREFLRGRVRLRVWPLERAGILD